MDPLAAPLVELARNLIDVDSTSGREAAVTTWLARCLRDRGYRVTEQPVVGDRVNVLAVVGAAEPEVVYSTHVDCVPPFFPSRIEDGVLYGRGACDAKGILAAQITALDRLREAGETRVGLLAVVGEEDGSPGARAANRLSNRSRYLINGEPTDNRLATATKGVYRVRLSAAGRAAHSAYPELGESAVEKLLDALLALRTLDLPTDPVLGATTYTVGLLAGGVAPNVVPPTAEADVNFRTVGPAADLRARLDGLPGPVAVEKVVTVPPVKLTTVPGFDTGVFSFTTDIPLLAAWGEPLLLGPGSIHAAHTADEHVVLDELARAVDLYEQLARDLLAGAATRA